MVQNIKATGKMINSMVKAKNNGQMVLSTQEAINTARKTVLESSFGLINHLTMVNLLITISMVKVSIDGLTEESTLVTG